MNISGLQQEISRPQVSPSWSLLDLYTVLNGRGLLTASNFRTLFLSHANTKITGISADNRRILPGDIFLALPGAKTHGAAFAQAAQQAGAVAVATDVAGSKIVSQLLGPDFPLLTIENIKEKSGQLCACIYEDGWKRLRSWAVTGTNGKTTTTYLLHHLLSLLGRKTGLIGTVELKSGEQTAPSIGFMTTPDPDLLHGLLGHMAQSGCTDVVMEVSSHGLAQNRTSPLKFKVSGFTNLSHDHLDYHPTMEDYYQAKKQLLTPKLTQIAVINLASKAGLRLYAELSVQYAKQIEAGIYRIVTLGPSGSGADWTWEEVKATAAGFSFHLQGAGGEQLP